MKNPLKDFFLKNRIFLLFVLQLSWFKTTLARGAKLRQYFWNNYRTRRSSYVIFFNTGMLFYNDKSFNNFFSKELYMYRKGLH